jgi:hypothetical protein
VHRNEYIEQFGREEEDCYSEGSVWDENFPPVKPKGLQDTRVLERVLQYCLLHGSKNKADVARICCLGQTVM